MSVIRIPQQPPRGMAVVEGMPNPFTLQWFGWFQKFVAAVNGNLSAGFSGTIVTAPLTGGGTAGSMTFENGILVSEVAAT